MFKNSKLAAMGLTGLMALTLVSSGAQADQRSNNNNDRNLAALGAIVAGIGIANHNATEAILGSAGAIYAISQVQPNCGQQVSFWNGAPQRDNRDQDNRNRNKDQNRDKGGRQDQNQFKNGSDNHDRR